jgi:hypothetical protein
MRPSGRVDLRRQGAALLPVGTETPAPNEVEAGDEVPEWARRDSNARPLAPEGKNQTSGTVGQTRPSLIYTDLAN